MISIFNLANRHVLTIAMATATIVTISCAAGSAAAAQNQIFPPLLSQSALSQSADPLPAPVAAPGTVPTEAATPSIPAPDVPPVAATLDDLVAQQAIVEAMPAEMKCLASAIYFEARGQSLTGQLAVGRVIVARTHSGRFPTSYCGVVTQRAQFSFVHGSAIPEVSHTSHYWHNAAALAQIADAGSWASPVEGALFFHASRVSPSWHKHRIAQIDTQVFYQ